MAIRIKKSEAISYFGTQQKLADALGITREAVSQWGEYVPQLRAYELDKISEGMLVDHSDDSQNIDDKVA